MDRPNRKKTDFEKYVIIDGIRYRLDSLYSDQQQDQERIRSFQLALDRERIQSFRDALKRELEILKSDHAKLETMYVTSEQRMSYRSFGLVECSFCQEGYRERIGNCPKCGHGPSPHKVEGCADSNRTTEMIMGVVGAWKYKPMTKKAKKTIGES